MIVILSDITKSTRKLNKSILSITSDEKSLSEEAGKKAAKLKNLATAENQNISDIISLLDKNVLLENLLKDIIKKELQLQTDLHKLKTGLPQKLIT